MNYIKDNFNSIKANQPKMTYYKLFNSLAEAENIISIGENRQVKAGETLVCLSRTSEGFFAIADECPHLGASLSKGTLNEWNEVICPWHTYRFNLQTGLECKHRSDDLTLFEVKIDEEGFSIGV
ncbi:MAG: nitrite reductase/ring-hydroxylating ferredoxin subunit [Arenicella sp.]